MFPTYFVFLLKNWVLFLSIYIAHRMVYWKDCCRLLLYFKRWYRNLRFYIDFLVYALFKYSLLVWSEGDQPMILRNIKTSFTTSFQKKRQKINILKTSQNKYPWFKQLHNIKDLTYLVGLSLLGLGKDKWELC